MLSRMGWRTRAAGDVDVRIVDMFGETGSGKSAIGNMAVGKMGPPRGDGFKEGESSESCTTEIKSVEADITLTHPVNGRTDYKFDVSDTQGVSDTKGRTQLYIDQIVQNMRSNPPNGIIITYNCDAKDNSASKLGYKAMKLCLNESLPDSRVLVILNKMPTLNELCRKVGPEDAQRRYEEVFNEHRATISGYLQMEHSFSNVTILEHGQVGDPLKAEEIRQKIANFPHQPLNCTRFKTFTEVIKNAKDLKNDKVSAVSNAENKILDLEAQKTNLNSDIEWHENNIKVLTVAITATAGGGGAATVALGIFTFGLGALAGVAATAAAVAGMTAGMVDSRAKIPALKEKLDQAEQDIIATRDNKERSLEVEKKKFTDFLAEVEEAQSVLALDVAS